MIELILLGMLYDGYPFTSYDLKKGMENSTEFFHSTSLGSIQPALKKMEMDGWLVSEDAIEKNRLKKYYRITGAGKAHFNEELRKDWGPDKLRCTQLVKTFFFDKLTLEEQLSSIDQYLQGISGIMAQLHEISRTADVRLAAYDLTLDSCPGARSQMDTLDFGLEYHQFLTNWFTRYKQTLIERSKKNEADHH